MWWVVSRESVASGMVERVVQGIYLLRRLEIVDHEACLHKSAAALQRSGEFTKMEKNQKPIFLSEEKEA